MSSIPITVVDAFAQQPFSGNPAGVYVLDADAETDWMQSVAAQMNLSETAFVRPRASGFDLRWFTPTMEVDLCGHATLAAAHVLWDAGERSSSLRFQTRSGELVAQRTDDRIELDFPSLPPESCKPPAELATALGIEPVETLRSRFDLLCVVESEDEVRALKPDLNALANVDARGVIVTARGSAPYDFVSRFFAPNAGVNEDPVTGSAHCVLAPYWSRRLERSALHAYQASARGGELWLTAAGDRVTLGGHARTALTGQLYA